MIVACFLIEQIPDFGHSENVSGRVCRVTKSYSSSSSDTIRHRLSLGGIRWKHFAVSAVICSALVREMGSSLLHGWGQDMRMMRLIQNELKDHYRVVNLDLPGFGESDEPSAPWGIEEYACFIHEIAEHDQMEAPILIAHSFGARIAIRYASRYPTKKMVLSGAAGIRAPLSWHGERASTGII